MNIALIIAALLYAVGALLMYSFCALIDLHWQDDYRRAHAKFVDYVFIVGWPIITPIFFIHAMWGEWRDRREEKKVAANRMKIVDDWDPGYSEAMRKASDEHGR
jgi:hypothetical protein